MALHYNHGKRPSGGAVDDHSQSAVSTKKEATNLQLYSSHNMLTIHVCACKEKDYLQ